MSNNSTCKPIETNCANDEFANSMIKILNEFKTGGNNLSGLGLISQKDIAKMEKAIELYRKECQLCGQEGMNDYRCHQATMDNLKRRIPMFANNIYPWKNYDWNYSNYIQNNYSPEATGARVEGSFRQLKDNGRALVKVVKGIIDDPIPNQYSKAGGYDRNSDYPRYKTCQGAGCITTEKVKRGFIQEKPYSDKFFNKQLEGENSSSYYFRVGSCPRRDIQSENECEQRGYTWSKNLGGEGGSCSQDRFAYIDNSPKPFFNGSKTKGVLVSIASDLSTLMPDKVVATLMGQSVGDSYHIQQCPKEGLEGFIDYSGKNKNTIVYSILTGLLLYGLYRYSKK